MNKEKRSDERRNKDEYGKGTSGSRGSRVIECKESTKSEGWVSRAS